MAQKKASSSVKKMPQLFDNAREKWGKIVAYMLFGLVGEIFICLLCGWFSGNTEQSAIDDNFVTALLQNFNYILGAIVLIPVIAYIYSKIKKELKDRFMTDEQTMGYGFLAIIVALVAVISVCTSVYPVNSTTWYGINSAVTVSIFLCSVVVLVLESLVCLVLKISSLLKTKGELWKATKKYMPIILMIMFLVWTFISCMLAPGAVNDYINDTDVAKMVLGEKVVAKYQNEPALINSMVENEVLSKTLNGCYNLKDGFWAFLMYGSIMLAAMLIGKDKVELKKNLIKGFTLVVTVLSVITLFMSSFYNSKREEYQVAYKAYYQNSGDYETKLTTEQFDNMAQNEAYKVFNKWYIYPQRGVFRNSNHFAYVLCLAILAAAGLAITEKQYLNKVLYLLCFTVMTCMLIVNNTFGGYLGVLVALICLLAYGIINVAFVKDESNNKNNMNSFVTILIAITLFAGISFGIRGSNGKPTAVQNIENFARDIGIFGGYMLNEENPTEANVSELDTSIRKAGSGRGETWIKVWELIKQKPLFGYGLECLLFQFSGQFDVGEGRTHNLLLQLLATVGIPGTIMYFAALAIVFIRLLKNWKTWNDVEKICVFVGIAYMVTALTGNSTYYTSPYFMMFLGFVVLTPWKRETIEENK